MTLDDELIEETERAKRVIYLRNLTGLSRRKFQEQYGISSGTLQHWESIKPGISINGAKRLANALKPMIHVTPEWILHGIGSQPIREWLAEPFSGKTRESNEELYIREELDVFKKHHKHALEHTINDDAMEPFYCQGDIVIGSRFTGEAINKLLNKECIVFMKSGLTLLRHLTPGKKQNTYTLRATNHKSTSTDAILQDVELLSAAPVMLIIKSLKKL